MRQQALCARFQHCIDFLCSFISMSEYGNFLKLKRSTMEKKPKNFHKTEAKFKHKLKCKHNIQQSSECHIWLIMKNFWALHNSCFHFFFLYFYSFFFLLIAKMHFSRIFLFYCRAFFMCRFPHKTMALVSE